MDWNFKKPKKCEKRRNNLPLRKEHKLIIQNQIDRPENTHPTLAMFFHTFTQSTIDLKAKGNN